MGTWTDSFLTEFHKARASLPNYSSTSISLLNKYSPEQNCDNNDVHFIYVDAAYRDSDLFYATAFAIFDSGANLKATGHHKINPPGFVLAAELQAICDGLSFFKGNLTGPVRILSDAFDAIHAIHSGEIYREVEESVLEDTKVIIKDSLVKGVWYCRRNLNRVAHHVTTLADKSSHPRADRKSVV